MKKSPFPLLKQERHRLGWTQQQLADQLNVTKITVGRWERGEMRPQEYHLKRLCALFQKSEHDLFPPSLPTPTLALSLPPISLSTPEPQLQPFSLPSPPSLVLYDPMIPLINASQPLIGRERDLAWIKRCLTAGENVALTALNGIPGVGKTALATAIASDKEIRAHFSDGILWAALGPTPNVVSVLSRWGRLLHMPDHHLSSLSATGTIADWTEAIRTTIGTRSLLLIIDDAWQLEEALAFRIGGPTCAHLLTTRFPQIAAHMTIGNAAMIEELSEAQSVQLLQVLAPHVVEREPERVRAIARAVGGLPLALILVGNYLRAQTYGGATRRMGSALDSVQNSETRLHLSEPHVLAQAHPSLDSHTPLSLQTILAVTDERLSPTARRTLYALSVFPAKPTTFSEEAALAATGATIQDLDELVDAGFLECSNNERYRLHQIIADYAQVQFAAMLDCTDIYDQLCAYILTYIQHHKDDYEHLEQEYPIILATLEIAFQRPHHAITIQLVCAFAPVLILRGLYTLAEHYLENTLTLAEIHTDPDTRITILLYLGKVSIRLCKDTIAHWYYQEGLQLAHLSQSPYICDLLSNLGAMSWKLGEFTQAEKYLRESLSIAQKRDDAQRMGECYKHLGNLFAYWGDYTQAKNSYQQALDIAHQLNDRVLFCVILGNLGAAVGEEGEVEQADTYFHQCLEIARQIGFQEQICVALLNLGNTTFLLGDPLQAEQQLQDSLTIARQMKHYELITSVLYELSVLSGKRQDYQQSSHYIQECLQLTQHINRPQTFCLALYQHGNLALQHNDITLAENYYQTMLQVVPPDQQSLLAIATYGLAQIAARKGHIDEARKHGEQSIRYLKNRGDSLKQEIVDWFANTFTTTARVEA